MRRRLDRFRGHLEFGVLAGERRVGIGGRERHVHGPGLAGRHADELVLEARNEGAGADVDADIAAGAALERLAVDLAGEVDHDAVAVLDLGALVFRRIGLVLLGDLVERLVDFGVGHLGGEALELEGLEVAELDLRQHFERQRIGEIGLAADHALDLGLLRSGS